MIITSIKKLIVIFQASILIFIINTTGCKTFIIKEKIGLTIINRSSFDVRIDELRKITFTDKTVKPWERIYKIYLESKKPMRIKTGEIKNIPVEDGYYGITICDGTFCTYTNFNVKKSIELLIENSADKKFIEHRFIE